MSTNTMKAIRQHEFGGPEVLRYEEAPLPELKPGEVLVRVHAVGINPPDWYLREGYKDLPPEWQPAVSFPLILGSDMSGVVEAVATDVQGFSIGDEVFGMVRFPSMGESAAYAEYVTAPASDLALKPAGIDHVHAAGAPMAGLTGWQFLIELGHNEANPFQPKSHRPLPLNGKTVLVNGAAGGVGHLAVQLAKWKGAHVIAVASGKHESFLRELGADEFIDYTKSTPEDIAHDVDLVLDTLGGPTTGRFLRTLKRGGALFPVFIGFSDAEEATKLGVTVSMTQVRSNGPQLVELGRLLDAGTVRVAIDSTFPLADARKAHERAARGHIQGKIVLTVV
ncbi:MULTISPECIES: NADP-dependent oxidoreductase [Priestia]|uniref:NADP-dependent oxidoreductase n=1 Tax=Priestia TaxID=2800373 RepID=UPI000BF4E154|nr:MULTISPECIES: NADP-dependent oxidoreductase [Priestia]MBV6738757.1 NADP-dependent oxidoreductase [Priestia megaterium]MDH2363259.1 NADP-dependent oxidoreductase [Priestia megaterium]MDH2449624.1 NADP-dependent oxidoreductase [Priestia megaterium]MDL5149082.1 NADP-dependent oxidoreductase [Priestia megaterium]MDP9726396.1 NADPH:quinone reductase-like Zn-dependent oxidoreductase [Priestia aryabhattai]